MKISDLKKVKLEAIKYIKKTCRKDQPYDELLDNLIETFIVFLINDYSDEFEDKESWVKKIKKNKELT